MLQEDAGVRGAHHPGVWALPYPSTPASESQACPSPPCLHGGSAHHPGIWAPSLPITPVPGQPASPSSRRLGTHHAHHLGVYAPTVPVTLASRQRADPSPQCLGTQRAHPLVPGCQACHSPWLHGTKRTQRLGAHHVLASACWLCPSPRCLGSRVPITMAHPARRAWRCPRPYPTCWSRCRCRRRRPRAARAAGSGCH